MVSDTTPYSLFGDIPIACGAKFYQSNDVTIVDKSAYHSRCFWIDGPEKDGKTTNDLKQGISWHIPDFLGEVARLNQYNEFPDTLCKSIPRLQMWDYIDPLHCIPIFKEETLSGSADGLDAHRDKVVADTGILQCDDEPGQLLLYPSNKPNPQIVPDSKSRARLRQQITVYGKTEVPKTHILRGPNLSAQL